MFYVFSDDHVVYDFMDLFYGSVCFRFSIVVQTGMIYKSLKSGMKYLFNCDPLSKTTLQGLG